jgi:hypothetical protein
MEAIVMGMGCKRCSQLKQMTQEVLWELEAHGVTLKAMDAMDAMAQYGPMLMPALVVGGRLIVSGRVPGKEELTRLIVDRLRAEDASAGAGGTAARPGETT